ncbi:SusF/SusE family outer membrane protein [Chitinophagaceae bacterium LB-8]|uniref:SusF/SusE family outer membrane protein n=1 Tax=Paraflavisolibacter caeni TaxID=2982496 RepID=A0A9X3B9W9_9BACT|nr:SusF/SusE family outer membrane protein [Paraflavisolibacter caeni]MCU7552590.1 SusF/SusE family outer membrane protein [Paraflavisolibacter caeni]
MRKILFSLLAFIIVLFACNKADFDNTVTGEALGTFKIAQPANSSSYVLNAATPAEKIELAWSASKPGIDIAPTYKLIAALKGGDLEKPLLELPSDNAGKSTKLTLTFKQLDDALKAKGIADGAKTDLIWSVVADNGSTQLRSADVFSIAITRFKDGATPFLLLGPVSATTPIAIDPGSTTQSLKLNWTKSSPAAGGPAVKYKVLFAERKLDANNNEVPVDWSKPLFTITSNNNGVDTLAAIPYQQISDTLMKYGFTNLGQPTDLKWTVVANSGSWNQQSDYINTLSILREVRLYMPGSYQAASGYGNDWTPATAPEMIRDMRTGLTNNMYYAYMYLPAGAEFKITQGRSWDVNYGSSSGGDLILNGSNNFKITTAGVYRISVNRTAMKYDISQGRMGLVGDATAAGWTPANVFPTTALGFAGDNVFVGIQSLAAGGWKMMDNDQWNDGSKTVTETRSYGSASASPATMEVNGPNFPNITSGGRYRIIWDGRNVNDIKYQISPAAEMRVVGDGLQGVAAWNPGASPQMTYAGNGKWTLTTTLVGDKEIKFLAGDAWGALDYEDNGDAGTAGTNVNRKLKWDGDKNFKTPASTGVYTIELDEQTQTVTIHP